MSNSIETKIETVNNLVRPSEIHLAVFVLRRSKLTLGEYFPLSLLALCDALSTWTPAAALKSHDKLGILTPYAREVDLCTDATMRTIGVLEAAEASENAEGVEVAKKRLEQLKKMPLLAFTPLARLEGLDGRQSDDTAPYLLDIDLDAKDASQSEIEAAKRGFSLHPSVIAFWRSRRGYGLHGLFLCGAGKAHIESAKREILSCFPKADKAALSGLHAFAALPMCMKPEAVVWLASNDEIALYRRQVGEREKAAETAEIARLMRQNASVDEKYAESLLRGLADSTADNHYERNRAAWNAGLKLKSCGHTELAEAAARILYRAFDGKEPLKEIYRSVMKAIEQGGRGSP